MAMLQCKKLYPKLGGADIRSDLVIHFKVRAFAVVYMSLEVPFFTVFECMHMSDDPVPCGDVMGHFL